MLVMVLQLLLLMLLPLLHAAADAAHAVIQCQWG